MTFEIICLITQLVLFFQHFSHFLNIFFSKLLAVNYVYLKSQILNFFIFLISFQKTVCQNTSLHLKFLTYIERDQPVLIGLTALRSHLKLAILTKL